MLKFIAFALQTVPESKSAAKLICRIEPISMTAACWKLVIAIVQLLHVGPIKKPD